MVRLGAKVRIRAMMKMRGKHYADIAEMTGRTENTIKNKMFRDNLNYRFVEEVADMLGFDIIFRDRFTGKEV